MSLPLAGRRVLVTRAARQASKLSDELRALGAQPVEVPVLEIAPPESYAPLDDALRNLDRYDWLILTSANAAYMLMERAACLGVALDRAVTLQVATVGPATAAAAQKAQLAVTLVPESYVAEGLLAALGAQTAGKRVLIARAAIARDVIPDELRASGAIVDVVDTYRNVLPASAPQQLREALQQGIAAATFTSSSSVTHLKEAAEKTGVAFPLAGVPAISIGPITSQTLREHGWEPAAEANPSDIAGLVAALTQFLRG
ncbi:MAG TPA: uroporphyrinogen-III synthase [Terracidiphilus sp.]|nr:uroporphyrinogen-III synthase [Terracidiphilus sp.]